MNDTPEMVGRSTDTASSKYPHGWVDDYGKNDWKYRKTYVIDGAGNIWEATLNITTDSYGVEYLYDIDPIKDMKKKGQAVKSASSPSVHNLAHSGKKRNSFRGSSNILDHAETVADTAHVNVENNNRDVFKPIEFLVDFVVVLTTVR